MSRTIGRCPCGRVADLYVTTKPRGDAITVVSGDRAADLAEQFPGRQRCIPCGTRMIAAMVDRTRQAGRHPYAPVTNDVIADVARALHDDPTIPLSRLAADRNVSRSTLYKRMRGAGIPLRDRRGWRPAC